LTLVVEPRLPTGAVYLATSPSQIDTVELGLLEENARGPVLDTRVGFDIDMTEYKARHTFGVQALDYRGMVKIPVTAAVGLLARSPWESRHPAKRCNPFGPSGPATAADSFPVGPAGLRSSSEHSGGSAPAPAGIRSPSWEEWARFSGDL
jgi:hypothetical protein